MGRTPYLSPIPWSAPTKGRNAAPYDSPGQRPGNYGNALGITASPWELRHRPGDYGIARGIKGIALDYSLPEAARAIASRLCQR
jgi:hypothetical protein